MALKRPLQWLICQLHLNELPFREVFKHLDGRTSGPTAFTGPIGRLLKEDVVARPITDFKSVSRCTELLPEEVVKDFSQDQKYLLRAAITVQLGSKNAASDDLKYPRNASPGVVNHARWLTCAN